MHKCYYCNKSLERSEVYPNDAYGRVACQAARECVKRQGDIPVHYLGEDVAVADNFQDATSEQIIDPAWHRQQKIVTEHLKGMIKSLGRHRNRETYLWSLVGEALSHGSGVSQAICRAFGFDPDELVGGLRDEQYCKECDRCVDCDSHIESECEDYCETSRGHL